MNINPRVRSSVGEVELAPEIALRGFRQILASSLAIPVVVLMLSASIAAGDDGLRQAVIDALISHEAAVRSGHWIGVVDISWGCIGKEHRETSSGPLELIWDTDSTWAKYLLTIVDRSNGIPNKYQSEREYFVHKETISWFRIDAKVVDVAPRKPGFGIHPSARLRPDEVWFLYEEGYRWTDVLAVPSVFPDLNLVRSDANRESESRIRFRQEYSNGAKYELVADERQGLNLVRWETRWNDWWHSGKANWKQTDTGVWYPESIEYSSATPPCLHLPKKFSLKTTSFEANPKIDPRRFEWRANVPDGTKFSILGDRGRTIREGMIGRAEVEKPEDLLNRLGDDAREGFPSPNKK